MGQNEINQASMAVSETSSSVLKSEKIDQTQERFVAFLDIMGFKDRVARNNHEDVLSELSHFQEQISRYVGYNKGAQINLYMFSDSIIIYSQDVSEKSFRALSNVTAHVMMYAIQQEKPIPLKGAIAAGKMTCNQLKQLFFGQPLIDAYLLEENVKYYGVVLHHSAEEYVKKYNMEEYRDVLTPLKGGEISHYELRWYDTSLDESDGKEVDREYQLSIDDCLTRLRLFVSDEPRKYIDNTQRVMNNRKA